MCMMNSELKEERSEFGAACLGQLFTQEHFEQSQSQRARERYSLHFLNLQPTSLTHSTWFTCFLRVHKIHFQIHTYPQSTHIQHYYITADYILPCFASLAFTFKKSGYTMNTIYVCDMLGCCYCYEVV